MKKMYLYFFIGLYCCISFLYAEIEIIAKDKMSQEPSWAEQINTLHMKTIPRQDDEWATNSYTEYIEESYRRRLTPTQHMQRYAATKIYAESGEDPDRAFDDITTCKNLELVCGAHMLNNHLIQRINRTKTEMGYVALMHLLTNPSTNPVTLSCRLDTLSYLNENEELFAVLQEELESIAQAQVVVLGFWDYWDPFKSALKNQLLFSQGKGSLNDYLIMLEGKSWWGHQKRFSHLAMGVLATSILAFHGISLLARDELDYPLFQLDNTQEGSYWCSPQSYASYGGYLTTFLWGKGGRILQGVLALTGACYAATCIPETWDFARGAVLLEKYLQAILVKMSQYMKSVQKIEEILAQRDDTNRFPLCRKLSLSRGMCAAVSLECEEFLKLIQDEQFSEESMLTTRGIIARAYHLVGNIKKELAAMLSAIGQVDAYCSIVKLYQEHKDGPAPYCFPTFDMRHRDNPFIKAEGLWHPFIDSKRVVTNDIMLGGVVRRNAVITGPNAGGKSTLLRSLGVAQIAAQSLCLVPARSYEASIFHAVDTYMNVTDDTAQGQSLFKAEVARAQQLVEKMQDLEAQGKCGLVLCDEILSGTNPKEGEAGAYSVANLLGAYPNCMTVIATHYSMLTELEEKTENFSNWNVSVIKHDDGSIEYPFKLGYGPSHQHVAFDIMRLAGVEGSVVDEASSIISRSS